MKAYAVLNWGSSPVFAERPERVPGPGEVSVRIEACGLNFADLLMSAGTYQERPDLPVTLGMEVAGRVLKCGEGVGFTQGERVMVFAGLGGLAETGCFPADRVLRIHDSLSPTHAAGFSVAYGTSHLALSRRARIQAGETLLVLGAGGGVGLTAVEVGKLMGARVIAVARGAEKLAAAEAAGADHLIDGATPDLRAALAALGGADVVYDPVGGAGFEAALRTARPEARLLAIGFASGDVPQIRANHLLVKNLDVMGFWWGGYMHFRPDLVRESLETLLDWHREGRLRPHVGHTFPFERTPEALDLLRSRGATGKIVVTF